MSSTETQPRLDVGTVLTSAADERYLILDIIGAKIRMVRIPTGMDPTDLHKRFWHDPTPGDPTRATLSRD